MRQAAAAFGRASRVFVARTFFVLALVLAQAPVFSAPAFAQTFPPLTGRVVDNARILSADERAALEAKLKALEDKTSDQVVVATIASLEGYEIEDYANRLFRNWKLGQARTNNGVLLLVAPTERKVRIEVGYGLEGALTDALSRVIIATAITPSFQQGAFGAGISAGIDAIVSILTGDAEEWRRRADASSEDEPGALTWLQFAVMIIVLILIIRSMRGNGRPRRYRTRNGRWVTTGAGMGSGWGGGFSGGGGGGGGYSGGGGSSGGGGASGSW